MQAKKVVKSTPAKAIRKPAPKMEPRLQTIRILTAEGWKRSQKPVKNSKKR